MPRLTFNKKKRAARGDLTFDRRIYFLQKKGVEPVPDGDLKPNVKTNLV